MALFALPTCLPTHAQQAAGHPLTLDDVLDVEHLEGASYSPDGEWVAAAVQRPARDGEVYGRAAYETDPSRSDISLISMRTGERRAITAGAGQAAGYWCAAWSPDGQRLAMLSTQPEGSEPRGGDNVRLYLWERANGTLRRAAGQAVMTETRYGSPLYPLDLRGGGDKGTVPHACKDGIANENAPFLWLDDHRLLVVTLPDGQISGLIDASARSFRVLAEEATNLHDGKVSTVHAVGSGDARIPRNAADNSAILRIVDVATGENDAIATVPTYPFRGGLSLVVSPDGRRAAVFATLGALQPADGKTPPANLGGYWAVERKFGTVDLTADAPVQWLTMPADSRYPLELYDWSPDSAHIAFRGRADPFTRTAPLFVATPRDGAIRRLTTASVDAGWGRISTMEENPVIWADNRRLAARLSDETAPARRDWWLVDLAGKQTNLTSGRGDQPAGFRRDATGAPIAISGDEMVRLDTAHARLVPVAKLPGGASIVWPRDPGTATAHLLLGMSAGQQGRAFQQVSSATGKFEGVSKAAPGALVDADLHAGRVLASRSDRSGLFLRNLDLTGAGDRDLLTLDTHLARVDWGKTQLMDYQDSTTGAPLKATVILPPDYQPGKRYPTLLWVYQGYVVRDLEGDYFTDPFMPGLYNLHLYAARGYVILIPSMPFRRDNAAEPHALMLPPVIPAIDRLVELGIADPERLGVMGQSRGGYTVYSLVTQTNRFKAAVAMAGISDLSTFYQSFDPTAYGYPGIEHEKSDNWAEAWQFNLGAPVMDGAGYARNSPIHFADRVTTPLLMVHGTADMRGTSAESEQFFYALYDRGKTARLLRYGGESHSLAQSPANIRDIFAKTVGWFDQYVAGRTP